MLGKPNTNAAARLIEEYVARCGGTAEHGRTLELVAKLNGFSSYRAMKSAAPASTGAISRTVRWDDADSSLSSLEGWDVEASARGQEIVMVDDMHSFSSDWEALGYVQAKAGMGSVLHQKALAYTLGWAKPGFHDRRNPNAPDSLVMLGENTNSVFDWSSDNVVARMVVGALRALFLSSRYLAEVTEEVPLVPAMFLGRFGVFVGSVPVVTVEELKEVTVLLEKAHPDVHFFADRGPLQKGQTHIGAFVSAEYVVGTDFKAIVDSLRGIMNPGKAEDYQPLQLYSRKAWLAEYGVVLTDDDKTYRELAGGGSDSSLTWKAFRADDRHSMLVSRPFTISSNDGEALINQAYEYWHGLVDSAQ
jgi:hypothetical protein